MHPYDENMDEAFAKLGEKWLDFLRRTSILLHNDLVSLQYARNMAEQMIEPEEAPCTRCGEPTVGMFTDSGGNDVSICCACVLEFLVEP